MHEAASRLQASVTQLAQQQACDRLLRRPVAAQAQLADAGAAAAGADMQAAAAAAAGQHTGGRVPALPEIRPGADAAGCAAAADEAAQRAAGAFPGGAMVEDEAEPAAGAAGMAGGTAAAAAGLDDADIAAANAAAAAADAEGVALVEQRAVAEAAEAPRMAAAAQHGTNFAVTLLGEIIAVSLPEAAHHLRQHAFNTGVLSLHMVTLDLRRARSAAKSACIVLASAIRSSTYD